MNLIFVAAFFCVIALVIVVHRSLTKTVVFGAFAVSFFGCLIGLAIDRGLVFSRPHLQALVILCSGVILIVGLFSCTVERRALVSTPHMQRRKNFSGRQIAMVGFSLVVLLIVVMTVATLGTSGTVYLHPLGFLIGRGNAEDNAKWLDYTAQWASGGGIEQAVPMGGPLQLYLTFVGTVMGVASQLVLGGYNEVAVAANAVVFGQLFLVALTPLALAPLAEMRVRGWSKAAAREGVLIPAPLIWLGALVLAAASLAVTAFGHLTLQFVIFVVALWCATFASATAVPRARLLTSLAVAASMTVWLPLNVLAVVILAGWFVILIWRGIRGGWRAADPLGLVLLAVVTVGIAEPILSSLSFMLSSTNAAGVGGTSIGVSAQARFAFIDSTLVAATGGTEIAGPILAVLAASAVLAAGIVLARKPGPLPSSLARRFVPIGLLAGYALAIYVIDFWSTGSGPNYGSMKFTFLVAVVALGVFVPIGLMLVDPERVSGMGTLRWIAVGGVVMLLTVDSLLPRAIALVRPEQWSPPIPFNNTSGSYWWPAEVNGTADQPISASPVACVYLPEGSAVPTAIVPSGLSDAQRVYSCSRLLAGLAGLDSEAQPIVDWLRREWLTNTPAWDAVYDRFFELPDEVLDRPVILLDDGSNVKGIETFRTLLARYPKELVTSAG